jgi:hypothetical protein
VEPPRQDQSFFEFHPFFKHLPKVCPSNPFYEWQPAHEEDEQPPHPELPLESLEDEAPDDERPIPKRDMSFSVFIEPHFSQATALFFPKTSFSKSALQALQ